MDASAASSDAAVAHPQSGSPHAFDRHSCLVATPDRPFDHDVCRLRRHAELALGSFGGGGVVVRSLATVTPHSPTSRTTARQSVKSVKSVIALLFPKPHTSLP